MKIKIERKFFKEFNYLIELDFNINDIKISDFKVDGKKSKHELNQDIKHIFELDCNYIYLFLYSLLGTFNITFIKKEFLKVPLNSLEIPERFQSNISLSNLDPRTSLSILNFEFKDESDIYINGEKIEFIKFNSFEEIKELEDRFGSVDIYDPFKKNMIFDLIQKEVSKF